MKDYEVRPAKLSCETRPTTGPNGKNAECHVHIEGRTNDLLNAYSQLTQGLFKGIIERDGKDDAMKMYAAVQMEALKAIGIDPEEEVKKRIEETHKRVEALLSILGKTFTMDGEEVVEDGDDE